MNFQLMNTIMCDHLLYDKVNNEVAGSYRLVLKTYKRNWEIYY